MRQDLTDITMLIDRSGSMSSIKDDTQGGINTLIKKQQEEEGAATFTLIQFDGQNANDVVFDAVDIQRVVPNYVLEPRDATPLMDAIGIAITKTGARLAKMNEKDRPGTVVFVIVTDGYENASRVYTQAKIAEMIGHQRTKYSWDFTYLGANQDAIEVAKHINIPAFKSSSYSLNNTGEAYGMISNKISAGRSFTRSGGKLEDCVAANYTEDDQKSLVADPVAQQNGLGIQISGSKKNPKNLQKSS